MDRRRALFARIPSEPAELARWIEGVAQEFGVRVEAVGKDVNRFQPGDEVLGACDGSLAEYACSREDKLVPKPAKLTFEQAAAVPTSACTALQGLRDAGNVRPGQKVLIIGAAGGVGTFAVQIARVSRLRGESCSGAWTAQDGNHDWRVGITIDHRPPAAIPARPGQDQRQFY